MRATTTSLHNHRVCPLLIITTTLKPSPNCITTTTAIYYLTLYAPSLLQMGNITPSIHLFPIQFFIPPPSSPLSPPTAHVGTPLNPSHTPFQYSPCIISITVTALPSSPHPPICTHTPPPSKPPQLAIATSMTTFFFFLASPPLLSPVLLRDASLFLFLNHLSKSKFQLPTPSS